MANLNILKNVATVAAASAVAVMATTGKASAITIDLGGSFSTATSYSYTQGGITVQATGVGANPAETLLFRNSNGLGVITGNDGNDNNQVDGLGINETLNLLFSPQVKLLKAIFSQVDADPDGDEYSISVDSSFLQSGNIASIGTGVVSVAINNSPFGALYSFTVTDGDDDYFLKAVEVQPVPEPLTMGGIALGATFGAYLRKRYSKKDEKLVKA
ncbi:hypothetical protein ACX27_28215 [Nostoc piscinale CENA21]|uniref:PEP-CTERM sorting domain-containing protein n=1 Tax=Nostoc piscinale CENA21 TaxID=224013 RepID=A0A0M4T650_9NOSO|nr:PEP-CTERM sorting domain-containing protein [Nostoc piscinale]ALF55858.1 hypothetical protein ACX27_28215 [Nostoc piscinale CENA21]